MRLNIFIRTFLGLAFGLVGILITKIVPSPELFEATGNYFFLVAAAAFGILGFISPDLLKLAGKAGIAALARQIAKYIQLPVPQDLIAGRLGFRGKPKKQFGKYLNPLIVDTSVLIDGRLAEVAKSGFVLGTLLVIPSVISELHKLADSADEIKRGRGRRGLDVLADLKAIKRVKVEILNSEPKDEAVDDKLVKLASQVKGSILTTDFNLGKVARVHNVPVLNINELANAVKTAVLPNERFMIEIASRGRERDQGVGYLADGTMVVVEGGARLVGRRVEVSAQKVLQTAAGKMIFGKMANF